MSNLYKACSRCGQIHIHGQKCYKNSRNYYQGDAEIRKFRNSTAWRKKSEEIRERDNYLCQICLKNKAFTYKDLSVHHIIPVNESQELRLDDTNLITVCEHCHKLCESGKITRTEQQAIVYEIMKAY